MTMWINYDACIMNYHCACNIHDWYEEKGRWEKKTTWCGGYGYHHWSSMRMVKVLVAHGGAGVAANEEGWFLLFGRRNLWWRGRSLRWLLLLVVRRWVCRRGWAIVVHSGVEVVVVEEATKRGERDWQREEEKTRKKTDFLLNLGL